MELVAAQDAATFAIGRALIEEYAASLGVDLCFQGLATELEQLERLYAAPTGALWLAREADQWSGCGALRRFEGEVCEMKRLYVRPAARGRGVGRRLAEALLESARRLGYTHMRLDTLEGMAAARRVYRRLGFRAIAPYYENPLPGVVYMECVL
ncbi:MAG TPA: GNAT family N-acetyltransferase [Steroidobacteraceae bacterium]|nr:GNAT family N-acetyltransferase [Steroidobacteraceae bacterium]